MSQVNFLVLWAKSISWYYEPGQSLGVTGQVNLLVL